MERERERERVLKIGWEWIECGEWRQGGGKGMGEKNAFHKHISLFGGGG